LSLFTLFITSSLSLKSLDLEIVVDVKVMVAANVLVNVCQDVDVAVALEEDVVDVLVNAKYILN
jgi:hypothetical protein